MEQSDYGCKIGNTLAIAVAILLPFLASADNPVNTDSLFQLLGRADSDTAKVQIMIQLSGAYLFTDMNRAVEYSQMAVWEAEESGAGSLKEIALENAMRICFRSGLFDQAAGFLSRHLALMEEKGDLDEIAKDNFNLGSIWLVIENYEEAETVFRRWFEYMESKPFELRSNLSMSVYFNNMGLIKVAQEKLEEAGRYYEEGIAAVGNQEIADELSLMQLRQNYGELLILREDYKSALEQIGWALDRYQEKKNLPGIGIACLSMGNAWKGLGDTLQALTYYHRAYQLSSATGALSNMESVTRALYQLYEETGPADSTLKYLQLYKGLVEKQKEYMAVTTLTRQELVSNFHRREKASRVRHKLFMSGMILLSLGMLAAVGVVYARIRRRLDQSNLERKRLEQAANHLKIDNELLQNEVEQKNKELAASIVHSIQKNEIIGNVVDKLLEQQHSKANPVQDSLASIIRELEQSRDDKIWDDFEISFTQVHADFYKKLNQVNPNITRSERRLCALLKLNMSTKEISAITGQTPHAVNIARTRLRKKLDLTHSDISLVAFLAEL